MSKDGKKVRAHLLISGRVQGVAFRYYTQDIAQSLEIKGWVRNCWDGKVEIVVEGEEEKVKKLISRFSRWTGKYLEIPLYHRAIWWCSICISIFTFCHFSLYSYYEFRIIGRS